MKKTEHRKKRIAASLGEIPAALVLKNASFFNVFTNEIEEHQDIAIRNGYIVGIGQYDGEEEIDVSGKVIVPGFIDGHMHLESSVVSPSEYAKVVVPHGTTAVIADPHEITNVCGTAGLDYMLQATENLPIDVFLMIPSCVPATPFDESGCTISSEEVAEYLKRKRVLGLAELMNYPGVLFRDSEVISKVKAAMKVNKIVDGHAPGLTGKELNAYITAGVFSDHECTGKDEALEKLKRGQWILVREGTACKNLEALHPLCREPYASHMLFVTDDKHPGDLATEGHIDHIIRKAISLGADPKTCYKMASFNAATYFRLSYRGAVCPGYRADLVVLDDFETVKINSVYKDGYLVASHSEKMSEANFASPKFADKSSAPTDGTPDFSAQITDTVKIGTVTASNFKYPDSNITISKKIIGLVPGEILTTDEGESDGIDISKDILKLAVVERHHNTGHIGVCHVKGYGIKSGAVATTIAHDSHNIIVVGTNEEDMAFAVMQLKEMKGGMIVVDKGAVKASLSLPIGGLMSDLSAKETQERMDLVKEAVYSLGGKRDIDPFMTLSFSSLAVIPTLRLTTLGVVDVNKFQIVK